MLLGIVLARLLEPAVFGKFIMIHASLMALMIPVSFSTSQLLISDAGKTPDLFSRVLGMSILVSLCKFFLLICFILFSIWMGDRQAAIVSAIIGLPVILTDYIYTLKNDLEGHGDFKPNFLVQFADLAAHASVALPLVWMGWGIYGLALGGCAGFIPQALLYFWLSGRRFVKPTFDISVIRNQLQFGIWLWLSQISEGFFSRVDKIFLGLKGTTTDLGYYNRALNFAPISQMALNSLMANATVVGLAKQTSVKERNRLFFKTSSIVFSGAIANWALWWWFSDPLVVWIFGSQWAGAIECFEAFSWLSLAYGIVYLPSTMLLAKRRYRELALGRLGGLILLIVLLFCLYLKGEVTAAHVAYSFLAALFVMGFFIGYMAIKKSPNEVVSA